MNLKKFFNTEEGGCIIFYIVLFVTLPSLFANFLQCSSSESERNCRDTIAMQRDSINYLNNICNIDTAFLNEQCRKIYRINQFSALHAMEIYDFAMDTEIEKSDLARRLAAIGAKSGAIVRNTIDADSILNSLKVTVKPVKDL